LIYIKHIVSAHCLLQLYIGAELGELSLEKRDDGGVLVVLGEDNGIFEAS